MNNNREYLQLAQNYDAAKHGIGGWYVSEKLDGMRAYWDGGITRGVCTLNIPFANTNRDERLVTVPVATGLWSRYGKVVRAPDWFLDQLPPIPLDGELFLERGGFQDLMSIVKQHVADERWRAVTYQVFDIPGDAVMFSAGRVNNANCSMEIPDLRSYVEWLRGSAIPCTPFYSIVNRVPEISNGCVRYVTQERLPSGTGAAVDRIWEMLDNVTDAGGEGLMLRDPSSIWIPKRTNTLLKVKKLLDSEAVVTGVAPGKGKYEGMTGALKVRWGDVCFELSGMTDAERRPGAFSVGDIVNFRYSEISKDGIPLKARYKRKVTVAE